MKLIPLALLMSALFAFAPEAEARSKAPGVERTAAGKIKRDPQARSEFQRANPCPATGKNRGACPGYVVDHVTPLKRGGADKPGNMQWQTTSAAKAKDKWE